MSNSRYEKFNLDSTISFLDFTKAFDTLDWEFMTKEIRDVWFG